jgi:hypothetical protein
MMAKREQLVHRKNIHRPNWPTNRVLGSDSKIVAVGLIGCLSFARSWPSQQHRQLRAELIKLTP